MVSLLNRSYFAVMLFDQVKPVLFPLTFILSYFSHIKLRSTGKISDNLIQTFHAVSVHILTSQQILFLLKLHFHSWKYEDWVAGEHLTLSYQEAEHNSM